MVVTFGEIIKARRKELGLKQSKVAEIMNVDRSEISNYETGKTFPSMAKSRTLRLLLEMSYEDYYEPYETGCAPQNSRKAELQAVYDQICKEHNLSPGDIETMHQIMLEQEVK